jgi:hypothetical protein
MIHNHDISREADITTIVACSSSNLPFYVILLAPNLSADF